MTENSYVQYPRNILNKTGGLTVPTFPTRVTAARSKRD